MTLEQYLRTLPDSAALEKLKYNAGEQNLFWEPMQRAAGLDRRVIEETIEKEIVAPQMKEEYNYLVRNRPHEKKVITLPPEGDPKVRMNGELIDTAKTCGINLAEFYEAGFLQQVLPGFRVVDLRDFDTEDLFSSPSVIFLKGVNISRVHEGELYTKCILRKRFSIRRFSEYENKAFPYVFTIDKNRELTGQSDFNRWLRAKKIDDFVSDYTSFNKRRRIHFFSRPGEKFDHTLKETLEDSLHGQIQENTISLGGLYENRVFKKAVVTSPIWGITKGDLDYLDKKGKTKTFDGCVRLYHLGNIEREFGLRHALSICSCVL